MLASTSTTNSATSHYVDPKSNSNISRNKMNTKDDVSAAVVSLTEVQKEALGTPPSTQDLQWRRMDPSLNKAVSPLLQKPLIPFHSHSNERLKAQKAAIYYSECFLQGVTPNEADRAAIDIESRYRKWWIQKTFGGQEKSPGTAALHHGEEDLQSIDTLGSKRKHTISASATDCMLDDHSSHISIKRQRRQVYPSRNADTQSASRIPPDDDEEDDDVISSSFSINCIPNISSMSIEQIHDIRDKVIYTLRRNNGNVDQVRSALSVLESYYLMSDLDARKADTEDFPFDINSTWYTLSKPTYSECHGQNADGDYIYSLGRMAFDMFRPTNLRVSIQGSFNTIQILDPLKGEMPFSMPRKIRKDLDKSMREGDVKGLRTYNIVVAFTIEPNQTRAGTIPTSKSSSEDVIRRPIRGIMTNYGYMLPDPMIQNRLTVWFTGGSLEPNDDQDLEEWRNIFQDAPNRDMGEFARVLAAKVLLGAIVNDTVSSTDGSLNYVLKRPIGGHGSAFCDVLYMDEKLRIMRGHNGSVFVFSKVSQADGGKLS